MSKVSELIEDRDNKLTADVKEILSILYQMADAKAKLFAETLEKDLRTAGVEENKTIPITDIISHYEEVRAVTSKSNDILTQIKDSIKIILSSSSDDKNKKNHLVDGIGDLVKSAVDILLGSTYGCENTARYYYIATDGLSLVRIDVIFWCRSITVQSIQKYAEKSLVCSIYKSAINVEKLNFNTFLAIYQEQLGRMKFEKEELIKEINNAIDIYKLMKNASKEDVSIDMNSKVDSYIIGELESSSKKVSGDWPPVKSYQ